MECKDDKHWLCSALIQVLIETLWNVKRVDRKEQRRKCIGFNRNIVECKDFIEYYSRSNFGSFNRNIVECKDENYNKNKEHLDVLIETLWNVKPHRSYLEPFFGSVLIETLWNVKQQKGLTLSMLRWF